MSDTGFLVLVLVAFLTFMVVLLWAQITTPSLEDLKSTGDANADGAKD